MKRAFDSIDQPQEETEQQQRHNRHDNVVELIGNTPVVKVSNDVVMLGASEDEMKLDVSDIDCWIKLEALNPGGSVKDRLSRSVIEGAERDGVLKKGMTVIEATSGNTGIGLAVVCAEKGYPLVIVMSEAFSIERRKLMRMYGAKVILTPAYLKVLGMLKKVHELMQANPTWFNPNQFQTKYNALAHYNTTGPEIVRDFKDIGGLDYFVTGYGTGGTVSGVTRYLREFSPQTQLVVCEPDNAAVVLSGIHSTEFDKDGLFPTQSHPFWSPHPFQGWSADYVPPIMENFLNNSNSNERREEGKKVYDYCFSIAGKRAFKASFDLASKAGILTGVSGGGTFDGLRQMVKKIATERNNNNNNNNNNNAGTTTTTKKKKINILAMLPDTGERYLSTPLFDDIAVVMSPEEIAISNSTPFAQYLPAASNAAPASAPPVSVPPPAPPVVPVIAAVVEPDKKNTKNSCSFGLDLSSVTSAYANAYAIATDTRVTAEGIAFVESAIKNPIHIFALEWCEFCWALKKFLTKLNIPFTVTDIDSAVYTGQNTADRMMGRKIRMALQEKTKCKTIPQTFIAGEFVGGCSEVFGLYKQNNLLNKVQAACPNYVNPLSKNIDPDEFLPKWSKK